MKQIVAIILCASGLGVTIQAAPVDYLKEVKPILAHSCYKCHGAAEQKGELRLDTAAYALKGGDTGPAITPGKGAESLLVKAVKGTAPDMKRMPLKMPALSDDQIDLIARWIDEGAKAPSHEEPEKLYAGAENHWSFKAPQRPEAPMTKLQGWVRNPIDNFILARLEKEGIKPSPQADRVTLIRRLSLDLTGLPPTIQQIDEFLADKSGDAYDKLVERLMASPHFGERWARHWLDVARYADSNGYSIDAPRSIWKYRDWVIHALNKDLPFDQFVIEQLAGDMLPNATLEQKVATGFHRNTQINQEGGIDKEQFRIESIFDRVATTGTAFLGLTIACTQCHDHKFDPISQKEYYQLFAFLNNADEPNLELATPDELVRREKHRAQVKELEDELKTYAVALDEKLPEWEQQLTEAQRKKLKPDVQAILAKAVTERDGKEKKTLLTAYHEQDSGYKSRQAKITKLKRAEPPVTTTMVMRELPTPRDTYVFIKGDFTRRDKQVQPGTPAILHPFPKVENPNRLDLARWLVDERNPLIARVTVNRIWQQYFGKGIVETENDFGTQGLPPSNPELLDWLATEFMAKNWSLKHIHQLIATSATYRQSSKARPDLQNLDANNKLLARQNRLRLDAELVRDTALSASGLLSDEIGGPSVFPTIPDGVMGLGQVKRDWKPSPGDDRYRRGMYTFFYRATPHPALMVFDAPDAFSACTRRVRSNTPLQALTLLNDQAFFEFAQNLATRVLREGPANDRDKLDYAFRLCTARKPSPDEKQRLEDLLSEQVQSYQGAETEARAILPHNPEPGLDVKRLAAWTTVSRVLLNLDETITRE
ncbi:MAG: PSD1 and planctomycete cytochrome C domain-containing protein [Verrucomicrobiota bacterium]